MRGPGDHDVPELTDGARAYLAAFDRFLFARTPTDAAAARLDMVRELPRVKSEAAARNRLYREAQALERCA
jgi:hypothetical protein